MIRCLGILFLFSWTGLLLSAETAFDVWRNLPPSAVRSKEIKVLAQRIPADEAWGTVYRLYFAAIGNNRAALLDAAQKLKMPTVFPNVAWESAALDALLAKGTSRLQAGLQVVSERSFEPLFALRDLDKILGREADYLRQENETEQANIVLEARDRLRNAYLSASRNAIEKLFALSLLGRADERAQLRDIVRETAYLNNPHALRTVLEKLGPDAAWEKVVSRLLRGDLELIQDPLVIPELPPTRATLAIKSATPAGIGIYRNAIATLQGLTITSDHLYFKGSGNLNAQGKTVITGHPIFPRGIEAESATLDTNTLSLALRGKVILHGAAQESYWTACILSFDGAITEGNRLEDAFSAAQTIPTKLSIAREMSEWYPATAMPPEARYLRALDLLRPHLSWYAGYNNSDQHTARDLVQKLDEQSRQTDSDSPWQQAHAGEDWMHSDIPSATWEEVRKREEASGLKSAASDTPSEGDCFWLLRHPTHPDVVTAIALLESLQPSSFASKAGRWLADLRRNNTVITFDVPGIASIGEDALIMMDVRAADQVSFTLYKIENPKQLAGVCERIGRDFIFSNRFQSGAMMQLREFAVDMERDIGPEKALPPVELPKHLVTQWEVKPSELPLLHRETSEDYYDIETNWEQAADGAYFNDGCIQYLDRLNRSYDPEEDRYTKKLSGWQLGRRVDIPGKYLEEGAYVLVAEANGQKAYAPLVVNPLTLTTRRCRDGIFALVTTEKSKPVEGARFAATSEMLNPDETSDQSGAAFVRMYGGGDRALIAEAAGRYAIAGFGRVFEGIYRMGDRPEQAFAYAQRAIALPSDEQAGHVFEDRLVAAAFTDRPTYRPGQQVQAKLILRELGSDIQTGKILTGRFREEDFDTAARLTLLPAGASVDYEILDPKGRTVASGTCEPNDFGTSAIQFDLNAEAKTGNYSIRLTHLGIGHVIPDAFQVLYYRRPNFEIKVSGIPETLENKPLNISVAGIYYFGESLRSGVARLKLVRPGNWQPLAEEEKALDATGSAGFSLPVPESLGSGPFLLVAEISDSSGRTEVSVHPLTGPRSGTSGGARLAENVPRFLEVGKAITIPVSGRISIRFLEEDAERIISSTQGNATLLFPQPGWYEVVRGEEQIRVFAFAREGTMESIFPPSEEEGAGWVNLADYPNPFATLGDRPPSPLGSPDPVWALFEGHHAEVGKPLRLLLYVPSQAPTVVITVEGRTIVDYSVHAIQSPFQVVELPVTDRWLPNAYLQACALRAEDGLAERPVREQAAEVARTISDESEEEEEDPRWCRVDVIDPKGLAHGEELIVSLKTDHEVYKPGDPVQVTMAVTDNAGKPKEAELALAAVDDSVFSFGEGTETSIAQLMTGIRPERRYLDKQWRIPVSQKISKELSARAALAEQLMLAQEAAQMVDAMQQARSVPESSAVLYRPTDLLPSGEIPLPRLRQDFRETAAWFPQVRTDANGIAQARFELPDSLTRYRITTLGLTRETQIGSARTTIRAAQPLSVQLFPPRFAVENDRLLVTGLVHNSTPEPRDVDIVWEASGVELHAAKLTPGWNAIESAGKHRVSGKVQVPAHGQARVSLPLLFVCPGEVILTIGAKSDALSDSERRAVRVIPWGRHVEFSRRETVSSDASIRFPREMVIDRMEVSVGPSSQVEVADALDGLHYLIDYPYGCVEQTMSRLMPAIVTRDAIRNTGFKLPQQVEAKLPDVIDRGLTRIYNFQHEDGGWGWWEKDRTDDRMSLYVLYGLARCKAAGAGVDAKCLTNGLAWLENRMNEKDLPVELRARGWRILALCGRGDLKALGKAAKELVQGAPHGAVAELALACNDAGSVDAALGLWAKAREMPAEDVAALALRLTAQFAFREPLADCYATAEKLTAHRNGYSFGSTWDMSRAIDGLARIIPLAPRPVLDSDKNWAEIRWGGHFLAGTQDAVNGRARRVLTDKELPATPNEPITIRVAGVKKYDIALTASGYQRVADMEAVGDKVRLTRSYRALDGKPLAGSVKQGEVFEALLTLSLSEPQDYLIVEDKRPAGCEYAEDQIHGALASAAAHQEFRDDCVSSFFTSLPAGTHTFSYLLRAESPGISHVLPGAAYPMYAERTRGETASDVIKIME